MPTHYQAELTTLLTLRFQTFTAVPLVGEPQSSTLTRLWHQQGKTAEAWPLLAEIYGWCIEGLDTKDLQEAKVLIEELSHREIALLNQ